MNAPEPIRPALESTTILTKIRIFLGVVTRLVFSGQLWEMYEAALRERTPRQVTDRILPEIESLNCKIQPSESLMKDHAREKVGFVKVTSAKNREWTYTVQNASCPECGSDRFELRTYGGSWDDADTHCAKCGKLIHRAWEM